MLKHLAFVEDSWFTRQLHDRPLGSPWRREDVGDDPDGDWTCAAGDDPDDLRGLWADRVERSRAAVAEVFAAGGGLDTLAARRFEDGGPNLRWIVAHMIEEYARHNGHADLLRESIDGQTGE